VRCDQPAVSQEEEQMRGGNCARGRTGEVLVVGEWTARVTRESWEQWCCVYWIIPVRDWDLPGRRPRFKLQEHPQIGKVPYNEC
jgi:hypothetical protein